MWSVKPIASANRSAEPRLASRRRSCWRTGSTSSGASTGRVCIQRFNSSRRAPRLTSSSAVLTHGKHAAQLTSGYWAREFCTGWISGTTHPVDNSCSGSRTIQRTGKGRHRLPTVAELYPEILRIDKKDDDQPSCSAAEALTRQEPFINQNLAYQALGMLTQLLRHGSLSYQGGFCNLETGQLVPIPITPAVSTTRSRRPD